MKNSTLKNLCYQYIHRHFNINDCDSDVAVKSTADYLMNEHDASIETAKIVAAQCVAELLSVDCQSYIDVSHTTSDCLIVRTQDKFKAVPIKIIMQFLDDDAQAA